MNEPSTARSFFLSRAVWASSSDGPAAFENYNCRNAIVKERYELAMLAAERSQHEKVPARTLEAVAADLASWYNYVILPFLTKTPDSVPSTFYLPRKSNDLMWKASKKTIFELLRDIFNEPKSRACFYEKLSHLLAETVNQHDTLSAENNDESKSQSSFPPRQAKDLCAESTGVTSKDLVYYPVTLTGEALHLLRTFRAARRCFALVATSTMLCLCGQESISRDELADRETLEKVWHVGVFIANIASATAFVDSTGRLSTFRWIMREAMMRMSSETCERVGCIPQQKHRVQTFPAAGILATLVKTLQKTGRSINKTDQNVEKKLFNTFIDNDRQVFVESILKWKKRNFNFSAALLDTMANPIYHKLHLIQNICLSRASNDRIKSLQTLQIENSRNGFNVLRGSVSFPSDFTVLFNEYIKLSLHYLLPAHSEDSMLTHLLPTFSTEETLNDNKSPVEVSSRIFQGVQESEPSCEAQLEGIDEKKDSLYIFETASSSVAHTNTESPKNIKNVESCFIEQSESAEREFAKQPAKSLKHSSSVNTVLSIAPNEKFLVNEKLKNSNINTNDIDNFPKSTDCCLYGITLIDNSDEESKKHFIEAQNALIMTLREADSAAPSSSILFVIPCGHQTRPIITTRISTSDLTAAIPELRSAFYPEDVLPDLPEQSQFDGQGQLYAKKGLKTEPCVMLTGELSLEKSNSSSSYHLAEEMEGRKKVEGDCRQELFQKLMETMNLLKSFAKSEDKIKELQSRMQR